MGIALTIQVLKETNRDAHNNQYMITSADQLNCESFSLHRVRLKILVPLYSYFIYLSAKMFIISLGSLTARNGANPSEV